MKAINLKASALMLMVLILFSCSTTKENASVKKSEKVQTIALFSTMIGKIQQPVIPIIDAAALNEKMDKISGQIMDMQKKSVDKYREIVAANLKNSFNCTVLYGEALQSLPGYNELKTQVNFPDGLQTDDDHYPVVITASGDINPFNFDNGKVFKYFGDSKNYRNVIVDLSKKTNADLIAVSYSQLSVIGVASLGIFGTIRLDTYLYVFDKNGYLVSNTHNWSKASTFSGNKPEQYPVVLDRMSVIVEPMMKKVISKF